MVSSQQWRLEQSKTLGRSGNLARGPRMARGTVRFVVSFGFFLHYLCHLTLWETHVLIYGGQGYGAYQDRQLTAEEQEEGEFGPKYLCFVFMMLI
jgi:hypothetical protein